MKRVCLVIFPVFAIAIAASAAPAISSFARQNWDPNSGPAAIVHPGESATWLLTGTDLHEIISAALVDAYTGATNGIVTVSLGPAGADRTLTITVPASASGGGYQLRVFSSDQVITIPDARIEIIPSTGATQIVPQVTSMIRQEYVGSIPNSVYAGRAAFWELGGSNLNLVTAGYLVNTTTGERNWSIPVLIGVSANWQLSLRIDVPENEPAGRHTIRLSTGNFEVDVPGQTIEIVSEPYVGNIYELGNPYPIPTSQGFRIFTDQEVKFAIEGRNLDFFTGAWLENDRGPSTSALVALGPTGVDPTIEVADTARAFTIQVQAGAPADHYELRLAQANGEVVSGRLTVDVIGVMPIDLGLAPPQPAPIEATPQGQGLYDVTVNVPFTVSGFEQVLGTSGSYIAGLRNVWFLASAHNGVGDTLGWGVGDISSYFPAAADEIQNGSIDIGINLPENAVNGDVKYLRVRTWLGFFNGSSTEIRRPGRTTSGSTQDWAAVRWESVVDQDPANPNLLALQELLLQQVGIFQLFAIAPGLFPETPDSVVPVITGAFHASGNGERVTSSTLLAREAATGYIELRGTDLNAVSGGFVRNAAGWQVPDIEVRYGPVAHLSDGTDTRIASLSMINNDVRGDYSLVVLGGRCPACGAPLEHAVPDYAITATFRPFEPIRMTASPLRILGWFE